jgi:small subunit ribosomal protein S21
LVFTAKSFCFPGGSDQLLLVRYCGNIFSMEVSLPKVVLRDGESPQKLLGRFRKIVTRSGIMSEVRKRRWFVSKNEQRRMDDKKAIRRLKKRARKTWENDR